MSTTIAAISTAPGIGGIAVIRVSGNDTLKNCDSIFVPQTKKNSLTTQKPFSISFGRIVTQSAEVVDEVLVSVFKAPHSFTGEDVVEISCMVPFSSNNRFCNFCWRVVVHWLNLANSPNGPF